MTYLRYYAQENVRHSIANGAFLYRDRMVEATNFLTDHFGVERIVVGFSDQPAPGRRPHRAGKSYFQPGGKKIRRGKVIEVSQHISYGVSMQSALTVAHEVAHYLHWKNFRKAFDAWVENPSKSTPIPKRGRWHGEEHSRLVDECVELLKKNGYLSPRWIATPEGKLVVSDPPVNQQYRPKTPIEDLVAKTYAGLPDLLTCPCCSATLPKTNFGVRVMKKSPEGRPLVVRRQSYCRACR